MAFHERYSSTPFQVTLVRNSRRMMSTLSVGTSAACILDSISEGTIESVVGNVMEAQQEFQKKVLHEVETNRARQRIASSRGGLP